MKFNEAKIFIDFIKKENYILNEWEQNFIESILSNEVDISKKQRKILEEIYEKATEIPLIPSKFE